MRIKGRYFIKVTSGYGFSLPGDAGSYITFWTNNISEADSNGIINFIPINTHPNIEEFPKNIMIHMNNCIVFDMKGEE